MQCSLEGNHQWQVWIIDGHATCSKVDWMKSRRPIALQQRLTSIARQRSLRICKVGVEQFGRLVSSGRESFLIFEGFLPEDRHIS